MRRSRSNAIIVTGLLLGMWPSAVVSAASFSVALAAANQIGLTVTNYGVMGNNFNSRTPSLEYPLGTGYEHLPHAGLWIGAQATDALGGFTGVTTAMLDAPVGGAASAYTEFTPSVTGLMRRSSLYSSSLWHPDAISELDAIALFDDATAKNTSGNPEAHRPLNVAVRQISHQWSHPDKQDFAIQRFVIRNAGSFPLTNVHVGLWAELASGPKNSYLSWPPSISGSIYGSWWGRKLLAWDGPQRLLREHRCTAPPIPGSCQFEITPAWMGLELLTQPTTGQNVTVAVWNYSPLDASRDEDTERYANLSSGVLADVTAPAYLPGTGDPVELLALGPFPMIAPGDSIEVAFALVGGAEEADILQHATTAQRLHDVGYNAFSVGVGGAPPNGSLLLAPIANPLPGGACSLVIELPGGEPASLELIDAGGRRIASRNLGSPGPGRHTVRLDDTAGLSSGVYFARLKCGRATVSSRIVLLR